MSARRAHVVVGGFPPGATAAHDMDFARLRILEALAQRDEAHATVSSDFTDLERWLDDTHLLITYTAGPHLDDAQSDRVQAWLEQGGRWLGLHGSSGGRAARVGERGLSRKMVKGSHHRTLGAFFLNHPPVRRFRVDVADRDHALCRGLPDAFEVDDELYLIELQEPASTHVLLTTRLAKDPSPPGFGFVYDRDTSVGSDGETRVLGYVRDVGRGGVAYVALGHCHSPTTNGQPFVDTSVVADGKTPPRFRGSWEAEPFQRLLGNGIDWGLGIES